MRRRQLSLLVVALLLGLTSCSGDETEPGLAERQDVADAVDIDAIRDGLASLYAGDHAEQADSQEGGCFATELLVRLSVPDLVEAGIVTDQGLVVATVPPLDQETATSWVDAQFACSDYVEASTRALLAQSKGKLRQETYATCLRAALTDQQLRAAIATTLTGDFEGPEVAALATAQSTCAKSALPRD